MPIIEGAFQDKSNEDQNKRFVFISDRAYHPHKWKAPITWIGLIDSKETSFTQLSENSDLVEDFDFSNIPEEYTHSLTPIVKAVYDELNWME